MHPVFRVIIYILAFCGFFIGIYFSMRFVIRDEVGAVVNEAIRDTMRQEFEYDRQTYKFIIEE